MTSTIVPTPANTISRQQAADLLNVSIRTLDRYIRRHYFDTKRIGRNVWVSKPSFERYLGEAIEISESDPSEEEMATVVASQRAEKEPLPRFSSHEHEYRLSPGHIYQTLYEELKGKYEEQVKRLEGAHYRVGQLEAQVKSMVPLLEYKKQQKQLLEAVEEGNRKLNRSKRVIEGERLNRNVYVALVYVLLAAQVIFALLQS